MGKTVTEQSQGRQALIVRIGVIALATVVVGATTFAVALALYPRRIAPATKVDGVDLSLLSVNEARKKLNAWWTVRSVAPLRLRGPSDQAAPVEYTPEQLGVALDANTTLAQLPRDDLRGWLGRLVGQRSPVVANYHIAFDNSRLEVEKLDAVVARTSPPLAPAKASLDAAGAVLLTPEVSSMSLVRQGSEAALAKAITGDGECRLVATYGQKHVSDDDLHRIKEVVSSFSTRFSTADNTRSKNLRVAAGKLNGAVLLPGERFSFNEFLGERTPENGFFKAGVYKKGKHDIDFGGGVCQVSTTLFNAVVLANLKIEQRNNHTFLVPYVPPGRDAAVAYGEYDMVFVNTLDTPIAIDARWQPGKLTFSVLGVKDAGLEVRLEPRVIKTWEFPVQYVEDPTLPPGKEKVVDKGGRGCQAITTKVVLRDGVEVSRETLCRSYYKGGPKIVARPPAKDAPIAPIATLPGL